MNKEQIKKYIDTLISHGEDEQELMIWFETFDFLDERAQQELGESLKKECEALKEIQTQ